MSCCCGTCAACGVELQHHKSEYTICCGVHPTIHPNRARHHGRFPGSSPAIWIRSAHYRSTLAAASGGGEVEPCSSPALGVVPDHPARPDHGLWPRPLPPVAPVLGLLPTVNGSSSWPEGRRRRRPGARNNPFSGRLAGLDEPPGGLLGVAGGCADHVVCPLSNSLGGLGQRIARGSGLMVYTCKLSLTLQWGSGAILMGVGVGGRWCWGVKIVYGSGSVRNRGGLGSLVTIGWWLVRWMWSLVGGGRGGWGGWVCG